MASTAEHQQGGERRVTEFLGLPVELRECIYEHYITDLQPATFILAKDPNRPQWTLLAHNSRWTPALLLVCHSISIEFQKVMSRMTTPGPASNVPISRGPTIRIEARRAMPIHANAEPKQQIVEFTNIPEILSPILSNSAPSLRLHLIMPQSPKDSRLFTCMLRFIAAICNGRATPLKQIQAVRDPVSGPGWSANVNEIIDEVGRVRCENVAWENWYRQWYAADRDGNDGG